MHLAWAPCSHPICGRIASSWPKVAGGWHDRVWAACRVSRIRIAVDGQVTGRLRLHLQSEGHDGGPRNRGLEDHQNPMRAGAKPAGRDPPATRLKAAVIVPPRSASVSSETKTTQRDRHLAEIANYPLVATACSRNRDELTVDTQHIEIASDIAATCPDTYVFVTSQKTGNGAFATPVRFDRHAWYSRKNPVGRNTT
jgi:hypothetical protein